MSNFRERELKLGIEGVALLRNAIDGSQEFIDARLREMRELLQEPDDRSKTVTELDAARGYSTLASAYDSVPCELMQAEEPVVYDILDGIPAGSALDAACGTGRHTAALVDRGHDTIGVDQSAEMLERARAKVPGAEFRIGDLTALPLPDRCVDLAVCCLATTHLAEIAPTVRELARVTRGGGHVIVSDMHPIMMVLQDQFLFMYGDQLGFVRRYFHPITEYLSAFSAAGLAVNRCEEPVFTGLLPPGGYEEEIAEAARAAYAGLPSALVWHLRVAS